MTERHTFLRARPLLGLLLCGGLLIGSGGVAQGAGYAIAEQSVSGLGLAFAGGSAIAEDASTTFYNPAGITRLDGTHFIAGAHLLVPATEFSDSGSTVTSLAGGTPLSGLDSSDAGETAVVPNFYYASDLNEQLKYGLALNAPFGLGSEYNPNWVGRYHAIEQELVSINFNPVAALKVTPRLSVGGGLQFMYLDAKLTSAVDWGTIGALNGLPLQPQTLDGTSDIVGDDWATGFNVGLLFEASERTRIGGSYRSKLKHTLTGTADFTTPAAVAGVAAASGLVDTGVAAEITTPDTLSVSVHRDVGDRLAVMGDISWTNWSVFDELRITFQSGAADSVVTMDWEDSMRYALGLSYRSSEALVWRVGAAFDESPIPNPERLSPRIPGADRTWLTSGLGYRPNGTLSFDVAYAWIMIDDAAIRRIDTFGGEDTARGNLIGNYDSDVHILSIQLNWLF